MTRGGHHHAWFRCYSSCVVFAYIAIHQLEGPGRREAVVGLASTCLLVLVHKQKPANHSVFELVAILHSF